MMRVRRFVGIAALLADLTCSICETEEGCRKHLRSAPGVHGNDARSIGHNVTAARHTPGRNQSNHVGRVSLRHHKGTSDQLFVNRGGRLSLASHVKAIQCQGKPCVYKGNCDNELCCQGELHRLLNSAADLMEKNNIGYYLAYGTLLGAVRDKDIMPYTADIDIYLTSDSIAQLLKAAQGSELAVGADDWGVGVYRGCENNDGEASRSVSFTHEDRTLPYIDFYASDKFKDDVPLADNSGGDLDIESYMKGSNKATIRGREYPVPEQAENLLVKWYGSDWTVPKESVHGR